MGGCALREVSGNLTEYQFTMNGSLEEFPNMWAYNNCTGRTCDYGLYNSAQGIKIIGFKWK